MTVENFYILFLNFFVALVLVLLYRRMNPPNVSTKLLLLIVSIQVLTAIGSLVTKQMNPYILLFIEFVGSCMYLWLDKKETVEDYFFVSNHLKGNLTNLFFTLLKVLLGFLIIVVRWLEWSFLFIIPMIVLSTVLGDGKNENVFTVSYQLLTQIVLILFCLDVTSFLSNIRKKKLIICLIFLSLFGLFDSKWWTGIGLLISIIGMTISKEFIDNNLIIETKYDYDESVLKMYVPYIALLIYISLVVVREGIADESLLQVVNFITRSSMNPDNIVDRLIIGAYFGMLQVVLFVLLKVITKEKLLNSPFTNEHFRDQIVRIDSVIVNKWRKNLKRKPDYVEEEEPNIKTEEP